jgi:hypothetical protein
LGLNLDYLRKPWFGCIKHARHRVDEVADRESFGLVIFLLREGLEARFCQPSSVSV